MSHLRIALKPLIAGAFCALPALASAATVDFEEFTTFQQLGTQFTSQGLRFTATSGDMLAYPVGAVPTVPESGSTSIGMSNNPNAPTPVNSSVTLSTLGGEAFDLLSLRASEGRNQGRFFADFASSALDIMGTRADGSTVSLNFALDGIAGNNPATDFETINFQGFTGLTSVTITGQGGTRGGYAFGFDDVTYQVSTVPLPAGLPLAASAFALLAGLRMRRKSRAS